MATKPVLTRVNTPPVQYENLSPEMKAWISDLVDTLNQMMQDIEDSLP